MHPSKLVGGVDKAIASIGVEAKEPKCEDQFLVSFAGSTWSSVRVLGTSRGKLR
jgi:hypothetical protein